MTDHAEMGDPPRDEQSVTPSESKGGEETTLHHAELPMSGAESRLAALIESDAPMHAIARELETAEPADAADAIESFDRAGSVSVIHEMSDETAAEALAHMQLPLAATVIPDLSPEEAARLLNLMDPDDAADLLQTLAPAQVDAILEKLPRKKAAVLGKLVRFDPETAGGIMTTEFLNFRSSSSVAEALSYLRRQRSMIEGSELVSLYCISDAGRLEGVVDLRLLLIAEPSQLISELMDREVEVLHPQLDREEVARAFDRYDFLSLPVVDEHQRVLGVITIDDVIDIIRAEQTEDALKQVGAGKSEQVYAPLSIKLKGRLPWLMVNLATTQLPALIVILLSSVIDAIPILAAGMGMIANQAGNAGQQSLAVTLRGLVLHEVRSERIRPLILREVLVGFISGAITGIVVSLVMLLLDWLGWSEADWRLGIVVAVAMTGAVTIGCLTGVIMPLLMKRMGYDPATASTIFLTTITDGISFASLLGLAWIFRSLLVPSG